MGTKAISLGLVSLPSFSFTHSRALTSRPNTKTFALKDSIIPTGHLELWNIVHSAQLAAHRAARNGTLTRRVDEAARAVINKAGYGRYFTHRLGHGEVS